MNEQILVPQQSEGHSSLHSWRVAIPGGLLCLLAGLSLWPTRAHAEVGPPILAPILPQTVYAGSNVTVQAYGSDTNLPPSSVTYSLDTGGPPGATIDANTGFFTWQTVLAHAGHTFTNIIRVTATATSLSATQAFVVTVLSKPSAPTAPALALPFTSTNALTGTTVSFNVWATNTDNTTNFIQFSLSPTNGNSVITNVASSVVTNSTSTNGVFQGAFAWTPTVASVGNNNFTITAAENITNITTTNVAILVALTNSCPQYAAILALMTNGGTLDLTSCTNLVLTNTLTVNTNVSVTLNVPFTNVIITANQQFALFDVLSNASLTLNGVILLAGGSDRGGAIYVRAGATGILNHCLFANNIALAASGANGVAGDDDVNYAHYGNGGAQGLPSLGGAIVNAGTLVATGCLFTNNSATGGSGGNGGNGGNSGNSNRVGLRGGNGGSGGDGALGFGGAIYSTGILRLTNCLFSANKAMGGSGGTGGTNGAGVFPGYPGTGGAGAEGSGGAIYSSGSDVVIAACAFTGNSAQGGTSAAAGKAGGGYGVEGAHGGNSYGGAVCLVGAGLVANSVFSSDTARGGNGGDGGPGTFIAGNGGNGGDAVGGCLYNVGGASVLFCTFTNCISLGGAKGVAGSEGAFPGRDGQAAVSGTNTTSTTTNSITAAGLPVTPYPIALGAGAAAASSAGKAASVADNGQPVEMAALAPGSLVRSNAVSKTRPSAIETPGAAPAAPAAGLQPPDAAGKALVPVAPGPTPGAPTQAAPGAAAGSPTDELLPQGIIDFRAADLTQVLEVYSDLVKRTVLRPATLPAPTITLTTRGQLTTREGIQALEAVLALNGISMINIGEKFVKALPEAQGNTAGAAFNTNSAANLPDLGQYVTHVAQLKYAKPSEMVAVLQPFIKIPNAILPIDSSQLLILRDYAENVKRMLELIKEIDVAVPSEYVSEVIPIKYAQASEIAGALNSLSSGGGGGTTMGGTGGTGGTRSRGLTGAGRTGTMGTQPGQTAPGMVTPPGGAGTPTQTPGRTGSSFSQRLQNIINRASSQGEIQVLGQTKIIADERTNSLLIYAAKEDMKTIKDIVAKLDVVLAQVLIEAVIIQVTLTDSRDVGFSYLIHPQNIGNMTGVGAINNKNFLQANNFSGINGVTNTTGVIPQGFSYLMQFNQDLDVSITAAAADSRAKILQRPRIQTSHNEPASLFVGESRPYPTSSYYGGGAYGGYSSIQQLQIGVTLEVTPLINPDGLVVMELHTKIDSFEGNVTIQNVGDVPVTSSKEATAKVSVRDHDTIILGGLIETDKNKANSGVPFLMDIPLLGYLFRGSHTDGVRKELMVLMRPTVLPTPEIAALTATAEKNKMPGVKATEREIQADETQRLKQEKQSDKASSYPSMTKP
jgi:general secretion pathway protein D